ncbi:hypothetical protein QAD02_017316 [Eretmocerus hayati]|uniref:Uncharacterized protein n=1 Tax=Eretmocerus hayati TaxID=131215 RepID=A0ACC2PDY0_9HYME|nr:hypothetical protein QAD02_017316 [Eretmocerus hayati]
MTDKFKKDFSKTRVIIDDTEIYIERSGNPLIQQSSFSVYKNHATLKEAVGSTPEGLISYRSPLYGGSTSDRQLVKRCKLQFKVESGDMIMADRGFTVQDTFAPYNVTVATPHFSKGNGYIPLEQLMSDRKLSKYRVHIERLIGLMKTYKISSTKLRNIYIPIATQMFEVCTVLCNFRENIMSKVTKLMKSQANTNVCKILLSNTFVINRWECGCIIPLYKVTFSSSQQQCQYIPYLILYIARWKI